MLIRLRNLALWKGELVLWHEMTNGTFAVKGVWGGRMREWRRLDKGIPRAVLHAPPEKIQSGNTFWVVDTPSGRRFKLVMYHVARHRGEVLALVLKKQKKKLPQAASSGQPEFFPRAATRKTRARR